MVGRDCRGRALEGLCEGPQTRSFHPIETREGPGDSKRANLASCLHVSPSSLFPRFNATSGSPSPLSLSFSLPLILSPSPPLSLSPSLPLPLSPYHSLSPSVVRRHGGAECSSRQDLRVRTWRRHFVSSGGCGR